jgi:hypothetical protein
MRLALLLLLALAGTASATQDSWSSMARLAVWNDAFVVEMSSGSPEADGADLRIWWSIQQPIGVEQARIEGLHTRTPALVRGAKSTIPEDVLAALVDQVRSVKKKRWEAAGLVALARQKVCPVRVKSGAKYLMLWSGKQSVSLGKSSVFMSECETDVPYTVKGVECFPHADGFIVRVTLNLSCGGDQERDKLAFIAR